MSACSDCRNSAGVIDPDRGLGWHFTCKKGLPIVESNSPYDILDCPGNDPCLGFQIGGYWTHMWFEKDSPDSHSPCVEWKICSDGEFPTADKQPEIEFHICKFEQLEEFVKFWRVVLERKGWIESKKE